MCNKKHECNEFKYAKKLNNCNALIDMNHMDDIGWYITLKGLDDEAQDYYSTYIEGLKFCPFCGEKLK